MHIVSQILNWKGGGRNKQEFNPQPMSNWNDFYEENKKTALLFFLKDIWKEWLNSAKCLLIKCSKKQNSES